MLERVLAKLPRVNDARVLVGFEGADDAGVYLLDEDLAVVQTVDFFTPIVDDPYTYGQIAAANALSDVYAMGGRPLFALSVLGFPQGEMDEEILGEIVRGGAAKLQEAGVPVIGGHSIQDQEIKFGYCVTGSVHPGRIWTNGGARSGDVLLLTKPVGTGIITTGVKYGKASAEVLGQAVVSMLQLNEKAARLLQERTVHAATDVTGFGLLGHAFEMSRASRVTLVLEAEAVPLLPGTRELAQRGMLPGGILTNRHYLGERVDWGNLPELLQNCFLDPQTSGGLLIAVSEEDSVEACRQLVDGGITAARVGRVVEEEPGCSIRFQ